MSLSRRKFIKAGVCVAAFATLPLKSALGQNGPESRGASQPLLSDQTGLEQLDYYTQSSFAPYLNTQFRVYLTTSSTRGLKLVEVSDYLAKRPKSETSSSLNPDECFSLLLTVPPGKSFEQDTYLIEHDALGSFYMFMVPVGEPGKRGLDYYEAIVYRSSQLPKGYESVSVNGNDPVATSGLQARAASGQAGLPNGKKTEQDVFYFRPQSKAASAVTVPPVDPGAAGRRAASNLSVSQAPSIGGLRLGMTIEQALALFPGSKDDAQIRASLSRPISPFGTQTLVIKPGKYATNKLDRVSQITLMFLDGRLFTLKAGYDGPVWGHVDEFVAKFASETQLPGADSWEAFGGMESQLKTLKGRDFEISLFVGANSVNLNYVQLRDLTSQQKLRERKLRKMNGAKP
jgi:hypothetical protein